MFKKLHKIKYNKKSARLNYSGGVTLVELLVVIFIFVVISTTTIFSYGKFNSSLSIQNLADDIALSVRKAQGYAIGVRGYGGLFTEGYGVHFTTNTSVSDLSAGSSKSFILFADLDDDKQYDHTTTGLCGAPEEGNECLELLSISSADNISEIYLNNNTYPIDDTDTIDLIFKRPNPEPSFCYRGEGIGACDFDISNIKVNISTDIDPTIHKVITISNNGQISVSN